MFRKIATACAVLFLSSSAVAHANSFSFTAAGIGTVTGTTGLGTISLTLTSLDDVNVSDAQALAGVLLTLSNAAGTTSMTSSSGDLIQIGAGPGGGTFGFTDLGVSSLPHWGASATGSTVCVATVSGNGSNCAAGGQPDDLILGNPNGSNDYVETGNMSNFNPFVKKSASFVISSSDVTASTNVTAATFGTSTSFVTTPGNPNNPVTPEPSSLVMLGTGVLAAAGHFRRKMVAAVSQS